MTNTRIEESWNSPFTAKRYLHPPFAENIVTMWPDFRVMCGDVTEETWGYQSSAFRILAGNGMKVPDFKKTKYEVRADGAPIHAISQNYNGYTLRMESFCDIQRVPVIYTRLTFRNNTDRKVADSVAVLARTGDERHLTCMEVDGYAHFDTNVCNWGFVESNWSYGTYEDNVLTDGAYEIRLQDTGGFSPEWQGNIKGRPWHHRNLLKINFFLAPGEQKSFTLVFRHGKTAAFDYEAERSKTLAFWQGELRKIRQLPPADEPKEREMQYSLVAQCLQMFCHPMGKEYVLPRQGGLQRAIWPVEAVEFLIALDRVGDFESYTGTAYELFFNIMQVKDGDDRGKIVSFGQQWANNTGGALWGLARHLLFLDDQAVFEKYREQAYLAFGWIERQRSKGEKSGYRGTFPPLQASDWDGGYFQSWCWTDAISIMGYEWLARAFEHYSDPAAAEINEAYNDYLGCLRYILKEEIEQNTCEDEILISNRAGVKMTDPPKGPYMSDGPATLLRAGVIEAASDTAALVESYFRNRGLMKNGLHGLMNDGQLRQGHRSDPWAGHTWYTSYPDLCWFEHWLRTGRLEEAKKTLEAQRLYAMTPEYYMNERYADNDPYFVPWLPNASANGRFLMMYNDLSEFKETQKMRR